jgi:hypothetical protein
LDDNPCRLLSVSQELSDDKWSAFPCGWKSERMYAKQLRRMERIEFIAIISSHASEDLPSLSQKSERIGNFDGITNMTSVFERQLN